MVEWALWASGEGPVMPQGEWPAGRRVCPSVGVVNAEITTSNLMAVPANMT